MNRNPVDTQSHQLIRFGVALFLLGLLGGLVVPMLANPRMGLSSHLEGVMNGTVLIVLGVIWTRLQLAPALRLLAFGLALYGTFMNWAITLLAAIWGAGAMMPIAAGEQHGAAWQEIMISTGLWTLSIAMIAVFGIVLWGLRGRGETTTSPNPMDTNAPLKPT